MVSRIDDFGTPDGLQPLRGRLGARDGHAVPVDEAGRVALGRHAQRHDRPLAERDQGQGRDPLAVPPRDRRRRRPCSRRPGCPSRSASTASSRCRSRASRWPTRSTTRAPPTATRRSTSRCSEPRHLPRGLDRGDAAQHPVGGGRDARVRRRRLGALRPRRLDAGARPRRRQPGEARASCSACS